MKPPKLLLCSLFCLSGIFLFGQSKKNKSDSISLKTILFVCEHGAARSTIAAAYFNKLAKEQGLNYTAVFKGTDPDTVLTAGTTKGLIKDSFDITGWKPQLVSELDIKNAYKVIAFDCKLQKKDSTSIVVEQWDGIPPISKDYNTARNEIVTKVNELIAKLPKTKTKKRIKIKKIK